MCISGEGEDEKLPEKKKAKEIGFIDMRLDWKNLGTALKIKNSFPKKNKNSKIHVSLKKKNRKIPRQSSKKKINKFKNSALAFKTKNV